MKPVWRRMETNLVLHFNWSHEQCEWLATLCVPSNRWLKWRWSSPWIIVDRSVAMQWSLSSWVDERNLGLFLTIDVLPIEQRNTSAKRTYRLEKRLSKKLLAVNECQSQSQIGQSDLVNLKSIGRTCSVTITAHIPIRSANTWLSFRQIKSLEVWMSRPINLVFSTIPAAKGES